MKEWFRAPKFLVNTVIVTIRIKLNAHSHEIYQLSSQQRKKYINDQIYLSTLYSASSQILHHIRSTLQYSLVQGLSVFHFCVRRSHLLPDQLPGEHTGDMAAVSTFLLQCNNLGKCTMFLHLPYCTSYNSTIRWKYGSWA